jgi:hypothetical protein
MKDIRITKNSDGIDDIKLIDGNFRWAKDGIQVANHAHIRMQIPRGTLSLNDRLSDKEDLGLQMYEILFRTDISQVEKELEIKRVIMQTPGYLSMIEFTFAQTNHSASYTAKIQTEWGDRTIADAVEAL